MVERLDPDRVFGFGTRAETERYCDQDLLIRQSMCPNGHGLMNGDADGQQCPVCNFWTNARPEMEAQ